MPEIKRPCGFQEDFRIPKDIEDLLASIYISYGYIENVLTPIVIILFIPMSLEYRWGFFVSLFVLFWLFVFCLLLKRFGKKIDFMFDSLLFAIRIVLPMTHWLGWLEESNRWFFFSFFFALWYVFEFMLVSIENLILHLTCSILVGHTSQIKAINNCHVLSYDRICFWRRFSCHDFLLPQFEIYEKFQPAAAWFNKRD